MVTEAARAVKMISAADLKPGDQYMLSADDPIGFVYIARWVEVADGIISIDHDDKDGIFRTCCSMHQQVALIAPVVL